MGVPLNTYRRFAALGALLLLASLAVPLVQGACAATYEIMRLCGQKEASAQHEGMQGMPCTGQNGQAEMPPEVAHPSCCFIQAAPTADRPVTVPATPQVPIATVHALVDGILSSPAARTYSHQPCADPLDSGGATVPARVLFSVFLI